MSNDYYFYSQSCGGNNKFFYFLKGKNIAFGKVVLPSVVSIFSVVKGYFIWNVIGRIHVSCWRGTFWIRDMEWNSLWPWANILWLCQLRASKQGFYVLDLELKNIYQIGLSQEKEVCYKILLLSYKKKKWFLKYISCA